MKGKLNYLGHYSILASPRTGSCYTIVGQQRQENGKQSGCDPTTILYYITQSTLAQCFIFYFSHFPSALVPTQAPHMYSCTLKSQSDPGVLAAQYCRHIRSLSATPEQNVCCRQTMSHFYPSYRLAWITYSYGITSHTRTSLPPQQNFYKQSQSKLFHPCNRLALTKCLDSLRSKYNVRKVGRFRDQF